MRLSNDWLDLETSPVFLIACVSALEGDNVVERSTRMPFYVGPALLPLLEQIEGEDHAHHAPARLPAQ